MEWQASKRSVRGRYVTPWAIRRSVRHRLGYARRSGNRSGGRISTLAVGCYAHPQISRDARHGGVALCVAHGGPGGVVRERGQLRGEPGRAAGGAGTTRVVRDAYGADVVVPAAPQRVVAADNLTLPWVLELGVIPVASGSLGKQADGRDYPAALYDLGAAQVKPYAREEPDYELLAALQPDLIIGSQFAFDNRITDKGARYRSLAPTVVYNSNSGPLASLHRRRGDHRAGGARGAARQGIRGGDHRGPRLAAGRRVSASSAPSIRAASSSIPSRTPSPPRSPSCSA